MPNKLDLHEKQHKMTFEAVKKTLARKATSIFWSKTPGLYLVKKIEMWIKLSGYGQSKMFMGTK